MKQQQQDAWQVTIREKHKLVWEGSVWAVTSNNQVGVFDIMLGHAQFVSLIQDYVILRQSGKEERIDLDQGIMRVSPGKIEVWVR